MKQKVFIFLGTLVLTFLLAVFSYAQGSGNDKFDPEFMNKALLILFMLAFLTSCLVTNMVYFFRPRERPFREFIETAILYWIFRYKMLRDKQELIKKLEHYKNEVNKNLPKNQSVIQEWIDKLQGQEEEIY